MLVYPQLSVAALTQFPVLKRRRMRTVVNWLADGRAIKQADPQEEITNWQLEYSGLSEDEASILEEFFEGVEGSLGTFLFLDPTGNLLAGSSQLDDEEWSRGPFLSAAGQIADPLGGAGAWRLSNSGAAPQRISQTLSVPGAYSYCLSVYGRAVEPTAVNLVRGPVHEERILDTTWKRITFSGRGDPGAESVEFGIELPAGASVDLFGPQAEPQAGASAYQASRRGGVYQDAYFRDDVLAITATDLHRHSATVNIIHVNHL